MYIMKIVLLLINLLAVSSVMIAIVLTISSVMGMTIVKNPLMVWILHGASLEYSRLNLVSK